MNKIHAAILAATIATGSYAAPSPTAPSNGNQPSIEPLQMQSVCVRNTCCHWGNNGDFWACTPR